MRRGLKAFGALIVLLALVIGIPAILAGTIGNPVDGWADLKAGDLTNEVVIDLLVTVVWIAWAQFALSVVVEAFAMVRRVPSPSRIPFVPGFSLGLAHTLIASVLLIGTATMALGAPVSAFASAPSHALSQLSSGRPIPHTLTVDSAAVDAADSVHPGAKQATSHEQVAALTYVVPHDGKGPDTYWDIAAVRCGGGEHWHQIWDLNRGRIQPDGSVMSDAGVLKAGWTILLPATATTAADTTPAPVAAGLDSVTVLPGDTLSGIAKAHGQSDWHKAWNASRDKAEPGGQTLADPNRIQPGWTVKVPTAQDSVPAPARPSVPTPAAPTVPGAPTTPTGPSTPPRTPSPPAPSTSTPTATASQARREPVRVQSPRSASSRSEVPMIAFAGGGVLLAGVSLAAMMRSRRRQFRWRGAGHTIAATPPELLPVERQLLATGSVGITDVTWLNEALRSLVHALSAQPDARLPDVVAVRMTSDVLELVLTTAQPNPPAPWTADETATRWSVRRGDTLPYDPAEQPYHFAPFPALASVGYTQKGENWLLDLERIGAMSLTGDPERCLNLARFLAAELAHNTWSEMLQVTLVGFGPEMAHINPDRLTYSEDFTKAITSLNHQLNSVREAIDAMNVDVLTGRLHDIIGDTWAPHVLLIAPHLAEDTDGLQELLTAMRAPRSRTAVALVLVDDPEHADATRWQLTIDEQGTLSIPALDVELIAQQIPADEAAELAQLLALASTTDDRPVPPADSDRPWDAYADAAGGLRHDLVVAEPWAGEQPERQPLNPEGTTDIPVPHPANTSPEMTNSILPLPRQTYLEQSAATGDDLDALGPHVTEGVRQQIESADPDLDRDLGDWRDPTCTRPKVALLGPVSVQAQGPLPERNPRRAWNTEVVAYLATRPNGVLSERLGTELWPNEPDIAGKTKVRQAVAIVRKWLGEAPTGQEYLPKGTTSGANQGLARYQIVGALVDAELFRRLRIRGLARGESGIEDLWLALELVQGVPFDEKRPGGYAWLADSSLDHVYASMIADTANTVATYHLGAGEPEHAAEAAEVALRAGSTEDQPLLNLMMASDSMGNRSQGDAYLKRIMANHDAEIEEDLPPHTFQMLNRRNKLGRAS